MKPDAGLQPTREIRGKISRELGNAPRRLIEYYVKYQRRFRDWLRNAPGRGVAREMNSTEADTAGRTSTGC